MQTLKLYNPLSVLEPACFCSGMLDVAEVREMLRGALFQIEIHDRDGRKVKQEKPPALFGEEPDDEKISSIALVAS